MYRTPLGYLKEAQSLIRSNRPCQLNLAIDLVQLAGLGFTLAAIFGVNFGMAQVYCNPIKRPALSLCIHSHRERSTRSKGGEKQFVRSETLIGATRFHRLVGNQTMSPGDDFLS
jgi:hypothetical protein